MTDSIEWTRLGSSGLKISKAVIGFMSYGSKRWADWVEEDEEQIFGLLKKAYDVGLRTYDTADVYSNGESERILGRFLRKFEIPRDKVVIMSKVFFAVDEQLPLKHGNLATDDYTVELINSQGLSRKHILDAAEASVKRLGTYIDLYQIHRYDNEVPPEETMRALNDVVSQGLARYIGASSMRATEFAQLQFIAEKNHWHKFISMQDYYNLIYREEEREMHHFCAKTGVGVLAWSPNARGILTRPVDNATKRIKSDPTFVGLGLDKLTAVDKAIVSRVQKLATDRGVSMAIVSTAWVMSKGHTPIVGLNSIERVLEVVRASQLSLDQEEIAFLEELYEPKRVVGFK